MATAAPVEVAGVEFDSVIAHKDAIGRWNIVVSDAGQGCGIGRGEVGVEFDLVLDLAIAELRRIRRAA